MNTLDWMRSDVAQHLALTLLHFLWQGTLVAGAAAVLGRAFRRCGADARHAIHLSCFLSMAICPVVTFVALDHQIASPMAPVPTKAAESLTAAVSATTSGGMSAPASPLAPAGISTRSTTNTEQNASSNPLYPTVVLVWLLGALVVSLRMWLGLIGVVRYSKSGHPVPEELARRAARLSRTLGITRLWGVFESDRVASAMAIGLVRPIVLLPSPWLAQFPPEVLDAIIAHELAHIRRLDLWVNLGQRVVETLLFYHPAVWWLSRRITVERELCCDEMAARTIREPVVYANALETVARRTRDGGRGALAVEIGRRSSSLLGRVRNVLGLAPTPEPLPLWSMGGFVVVSVVLVAGALNLSPPLSADQDLNAVRSEMMDGLTRIERDLRELRDTIENLVAAGVLRRVEDEVDFAGSQGRLHADNYFELGRFAAAARGYRAVLSHDPDHPDALDFLRRIREAHRSAGELGAAIEVQRSILDQHEVDDLYRERMKLADLEMQAKRYGHALRTCEQAINAATNWEERVTGSMFRAWYIELLHGPEAGLRAYQELERRVHSMGLEGQRIRQKIERLERIIAKSSG